MDAGPGLPLVVEWVDAPERVERLLPRVKELLVEAAHYEILVEGLPDVIADAAYEQMKWNEFKGRPSLAAPVGIDAASLQFRAGTHVFDPAVVSYAQPAAADVCDASVTVA